MDTNKIKEIVELMKSSDLTSMEIKEGDFKIKLKKEKEIVAGITQQASAPAQIPDSPKKLSKGRDKNIEAVVSPLVGTLYKAKTEGEEPIVSVGDKVKSGDVLCLIEAMKMFSEIKSPCDGTIKEVLFDNEDFAEFGQEIILIEKK